MLFLLFILKLTLLFWLTTDRVANDSLLLVQLSFLHFPVTTAFTSGLSPNGFAQEES